MHRQPPIIGQAVDVIPMEFFGGARTVGVHVRRVRVKLCDRHAARLRTVRRVG